jgi:hypothetical protein
MLLKGFTSVLPNLFHFDGYATNYNSLNLLFGLMQKQMRNQRNQFIVLKHNLYGYLYLKSKTC